MRVQILVLAAVAMVPPLLAQVTPDQRVLDFQVLANIYARRYAPMEWKKQALNFDMANVAPWIDRVRRAKDDLEYHEIAMEYVAMLEDTHSSYRAPGIASASLGFAVDIYDGKVLIEAIDRSRLPQSEYPIAVGDELVSMDGRTAEEWITHMSRFRKAGNPTATRRLAADRITFRAQSSFPRVGELGDSATVVVQRASGEMETLTIPWVKTNIPYAGSPRTPKAGDGRQAQAESGYMETIREMWNWSAPQDESVLQGIFQDDEGDAVPRRYLLGYGGRNPTFMLPQSFVLRLGRSSADFHFSGVYQSDGLRIGYLRIPNFAPPNTSNAIRELETEIQFLNANTDGLVVDVSRNTGGGCYMLDVAQRLMQEEFWFFGEEVRPTWDRIQALQSTLEFANRQNADEWVTAMLTYTRDRLLEAYRSGAHRSEPIPACSWFNSLAAGWYNQPAEVRYAKPLIVLVDEFSTSAGDIFPAMMQDNNRGPLVGMRSNGAGGSVSVWPAGPLTEGQVSNTNSLVVRKEFVAKAAEFPANRYIENTGVRPDVVLDRMTRENLMNGGRPFVEAFTKVLVDHIRANQ